MLFFLLSSSLSPGAHSESTSEEQLRGQVGGAVSKTARGYYVSKYQQSKTARGCVSKTARRCVSKTARGCVSKTVM